MRIKLPFVTFITFVAIILILGISYFFLKDQLPCSVSIVSNSKNLSVRIKDKNKMKQFVNKLQECEDGWWVFIPPQTSPEFVKSIRLEITDDAQTNSFRSAQKTVLYTYSYTFDNKKNQAVVKLQFPNKEESFGATIHWSIFFTSYQLLKGKLYDEQQQDLLVFNSLESLGIAYEIH